MEPRKSAFRTELTCHGRNGLFSRPSQSDQAQVSIEMGQPYDLDAEVEGLSGQVGKLKLVSPLASVLWRTHVWAAFNKLFPSLQLARAIGQEADENRKVSEGLVSNPPGYLASACETVLRTAVRRYWSAGGGDGANASGYAPRNEASEPDLQAEQEQPPVVFGALRVRDGSCGDLLGQAGQDASDICVSGLRIVLRRERERASERASK